MELVQAHQRLQDEPLHLAIAYDPGRERDHVFLFEIVGNFGSELIDPDRRFFEVGFSGAQVFMARPPDLRLVLTSPTEFREALRDGWPVIAELRRAIASQRYQIMYQDDVGRRLFQELAPREAAA
jgi:hypothetical protein